MPAVRGKRVQATPRNGSALRDYAIGECIGKGAFAKVFKAIDVNTAQIVAIKEIPLSEISSVETVMREIELLKDLSHPNIVQYLGYVKTNDVFHIVLEYCENGSLAAILSKFGNFPENLLSIYISQVLQGLVYLHAQGTIHRDIKGANILTTKDGVAKLADFGVATDTKSSEEGVAVVGTPHFMAPEIIQLQEPTTACDVWSLGCTIIELSSGKPPYYNLTSMAAMWSMVNDDCPPIPAEMGPLVRDFLSLCFQKDPNLRSSAAQLLEHAWIRRAKKPPAVPDAVKTIQQWNQPLRKKKLGVASRLDLRSAYEAAERSTEFIPPDGDCSPRSPPKKKSRMSKASERTAKLAPVSAFIESDGDEFGDLADQFELKPEHIPKPKRLGSGRLDPPPDENTGDPFEGIAELLVDEPNQKLVGIQDETQMILKYIHQTKLQEHITSPLDVYYLRLCELITAEPSVKKLLAQHRTLGNAITTAQIVRDQKIIAAVLDFIHLMVLNDESALETFSLNSGLRLLLSLLSFQTTRCLLVLKQLVTIYPFGPRLVVCESQFLSALSILLHTNSGDELVITLTAQCIETIFEKFGPRKKVELWYLFNQNDLLANLVEAIDNKPPQDAAPILYSLISSFSRLPTELVGEFISKHIVRKLMHVYRHLATNSKYRLDILRFYKTISTVPEALDAMQRGSLAAYFVRILKDSYRQPRGSGTAHLTATCILPLFHNFCRLNPGRQAICAKEGLVPLLLETHVKEPELKEFSLPILCAMAHSGGDICWDALWSNGGLEALVTLINEAGWETQAIAAVVSWLTRQPERLEVRFIKVGGIRAIIQAVDETRNEIFSAVITSVATLVDYSTGMRELIPAKPLFLALKFHLSQKQTSTTLVKILLVIRRILEGQEDAASALIDTGISDKIAGLVDQDDLPVICKRLAKQIGTALRAL